MEKALTALLSTRSPRIGHQELLGALSALPTMGYVHWHRSYSTRMVTAEYATSIMALLAWAKRAMTDDGFATEQIYQALPSCWGSHRPAGGDTGHILRAVRHGRR